ncbi:hypothetical protein [Chamaesiphon sp.]|uniref:hypothetical protein n=1 Tax=Chamaesiphon sp. TaxID=2814140 RepID=UPI00359321B3
MTNQNCLTSVCRYCRFYRPEGVHGGACQQLGVSVHSDWKACQLGLPAFANSWENVQELATTNRQVEVIESQADRLHSVTTLELSARSIGVNN